MNEYRSVIITMLCVPRFLFCCVLNCIVAHSAAVQRTQLVDEARALAAIRKWSKSGANTANHATATPGLSSHKFKHRKSGRRPQRDHRRMGGKQAVTGALALVRAMGATRAIEREAEVAASSRASSSATLMPTVERSFNKSMPICSNDTMAKAATPAGRDRHLEALSQVTIAATAAVAMTVRRAFAYEAGNRAGQGVSLRLLQGRTLGSFSARHIAWPFLFAIWVVL